MAHSSPARPLLLALLACVPLAGCAQPRELLADGGFEAGLGPWHAIAGDPNWIPPELAAQAFAGNASLRTHLVPRQTAGLSVIAGALQQVQFTPGAALPRTLTGHYFVRHWNSTAARTYLQAVVMLYARNGTADTQCQQLPNEYPCQVAFVLGGVSERPLNVANRRFVFVATPVPQAGRWTDFSIPVADTFRDEWGAVDPPARELRVYLEVRYEKADKDDAHAADVDVLWDGLSLR
ncbi:MAG: hypothetical protein QOI63_1215 [Thermoplasmata archaeon]|jgi:hypothetical protein|nr:hypothetical protein [Thermoplasmata archaeon]